MKEAASLLREKRLSVSEVGYALGFSNLSHFSRVKTTPARIPRNFQPPDPDATRRHPRLYVPTDGLIER